MNISDEIPSNGSTREGIVKIPALLVSSLFLVACSNKPSAPSVCQKLVETGVAANCRAGQPTGLGAAAVESAEFDLPSVPGHGGAVFRFDAEAPYDSTVAAFAKAAVLAGPHRYGSKRSLIFVQANEKLSADNGAKMKAAVDAL